MKYQCHYVFDHCTIDGEPVRQLVKQRDCFSEDELDAFIKYIQRTEKPPAGARREFIRETNDNFILDVA